MTAYAEAASDRQVDPASSLSDLEACSDPSGSGP